ncbi:hypothetical protein PYCCODRAFT_1379249 [Trametes coccinea BRFM310]|uniref:CMP/dCMP-type deaminase domain-containing protein n=1 Tax=Trametes coccinea (strain BRFM310) TaxID=1353009 RepID=A0A1Y2I706_TRAC3|nr:hypothetical protein PYCCODRAFT_1379249 [Trametes coccinea BRFM310]
MNKTQFYLSQCAEAASKSPMCFTLGAVMVKGGKVISSGYNHHRPHYDGSELKTHGHRKPVSMHAEMHAIFSLTGMSPSFKTQVQGMERRGQKGLRAPRRVSRGPLTPTTMLPSAATTSTTAAPSSKPSKGKSKQRHRSSSRHSSSSGLGHVLSGASSSEESSGSESSRPSSHGRPRSSSSSCSPSASSKTVTRTRQPREIDKLWDARRRDPRANGADIYVARFTKNGMGTAKPCWRCLEWCRWAGVKRIFHWNAEEGKFDVVKVNSAESGQYETHADIRLFAGLVSVSGCLPTVYLRGSQGW